MALLEVEDLHVSFPTEDGEVQAVRGVSFEVAAGETVGIVGESGSGKSVTTQAIMRLVRGARVNGRAAFDGSDLLTMPEPALRRVRGDRVGMVFQDPLSSLHPQYKVGWQIVEAIRAHERVSAARARTRAIALLEEVGIPEPGSRVDDFPHQFSGGMRQRVMLAMALSRRPELLIADEPTTALDVTVQAQLLDLLARLQREHGTAVVLITHDLGVIAEVADRVLTMYAGRIVERATRHELFARAHHPYTRGLLACVPGGATRGGRLIPIAGQPPSMLRPPPGCAFAPRCPEVMPACREAIPPEISIRTATADGDEHTSACILPVDRAGAPVATSPDRGLRPVDVRDQPIVSRPAEPLVALRGLVKHFPGPRRGLLGRGSDPVRAVDGIDLDVWPGETLAIVGESGSGKSTLARLITGLIAPTAGTVSIGGTDLATLDRRGMTAMRREMQMIFQDPYGSLNPRRRVGSIIADPLVIHGTDDGRRRERVQELMALVGLNPEHYNRYPSEFSGGQRQRIGVARALALNPGLVVCDEPVSALDVSIQAQIVNLLEALQDRLDLTYVVIAHDLGVVQHLADRVAVMYLGRIVEVGAADEVFDDPRHPYTRALLDAAPVADPTALRQRAPLTGDVGSPIAPPAGCRFNPRCPRREEDCTTVDPALQVHDGDGPDHTAACIHPLLPDQPKPDMEVV